MSTPEKKPKDDGKDVKPELGAILPDMFSDLDNYQQKIEQDWEETKNSYKNKINDILEDFMAQNPATGEKTPSMSKPSAPSEPRIEPVSSAEERMERLLSRVERSLHSSEERSRIFSGWRMERPSIINIGWDGSHETLRRWRGLGLAAAAALLIIGGAYSHFFRIADVTPLPYIHPSTIAFVDDKAYIVEWFRKALYEHRLEKDFPINQVENIPNNFLSGVAFSDKHLWTLDAFGKQFLQHSLSGDHRVLKSFPTPADKPAGLYFDGTDIWSADLSEKKIYRHHAADPESIKMEYGFANFNVTSLYFKQNRLWVLDGKSRMVYQCRLEDPLRVVATYDLDPVLKGATPNDFTMRGDTLWLLTENPPQLMRLSEGKLKKLAVR